MRLINMVSNVNIVFNSYWGKRDENIFLPTKNSLSIGLEALQTTTSISLYDCDKITLDGKLLDQEISKNIRTFLGRFRKLYGIKECFSIESTNHFPTAAGLASSASGYAALALGLNKLCKIALSKKECSILARQGSGSASRSVYGGFVQWHKGKQADGSDSYAEQLFDANHWPELRVIIAIVDRNKKKISSRSGMQQTVATSNFYYDWLQKSDNYLNELISGIKERDLEHVGQATEADWYGMYQSMRDTKPCLDYLNDASHEIINQVKIFRNNGISCYFTTDAGPNVKIICLQKDVQTITSALQQTMSIENIIISRVALEPLIQDI